MMVQDNVVALRTRRCLIFFCACVRLRAGLVLFSVSPTFKGLCLRRAARVKALMKCNMYVRLCCSGRKRDSVICDSLKHISCFYSWSSPCRKQSSVSMPWRSSVLLKTTTANCVCCSRCLASRTMQSSRQENDNFASWIHNTIKQLCVLLKVSVCSVSAWISYFSALLMSLRIGTRARPGCSVLRRPARW